MRDWSRDEVTGWRVLDKILAVFLSFSPNGVYAGSVADRGGPTVMIDTSRALPRSSPLSCVQSGSRCVGYAGAGLGLA